MSISVVPDTEQTFNYDENELDPELMAKFLSHDVFHYLDQLFH